MEYGNLEIYIWQVAPMPNDPLYSKMQVEHDFQIAIDQDDVFKFIKLLQSCKAASLTCSVLPPGQPHSCDNPRETWGHPCSIFTKLNIEAVFMGKEYGTIGSTGDTITLSLDASQFQELAVTIKRAVVPPVFFEYDHYFLVKNKSDKLIKINIWGWCQDGQIQYAN